LKEAADEGKGEAGGGPMNNDPVDEQLAGWRQALQQGQRLEPVEVAKRVLGAKFQMAVAMRLGVGGFHHEPVASLCAWAQAHKGDLEAAHAKRKKGRTKK
jgi:hypothetical protein